MTRPRKIGPYTILGKLGAGATAITYLALDETPSSEGASAPLTCIKTPHPACAEDPVFVQAFLDEAAIARTLQHPHIVRLQQIGRDPRTGVIYLVYPFVQGMDLGELITAMHDARAQLSWPIVVLIAQQIARALEHAHEDQRELWRQEPRAPVIHRDVCPPNVLLGLGSGAAYLTDFGLARAAAMTSSQPRLRRSRDYAGRIAYSAPEYLSGAEYDARIDLFSTGVLLFEALTGVRPFAAATHEGHARQHILDVEQRRRPRIADLRGEFHSSGAPPPDGLLTLIRIVDRLLEPHPEDRFPSAGALGDALSAIPLPADVHRHLQVLVQTFRPTSRRLIRAHTTSPDEDGEWSSTNADPLRSHLAPGARDNLHVSPSGAAQLMAAFAMQPSERSDESVPDPDLTSTDPDPDPHFAELDALPATRPNRRVIPTTIDSASMSAADAIIPATFDPGKAAPFARTSLTAPSTPSTEPAQPFPTAPGSSPPRAAAAPQPSEFSIAHARLPAFDERSIRRPQQVRRIASLALVFVALLSFCVVGTSTMLLVPAATRFLGHGWRPLYAFVATAGLVLSIVAIAIAARLHRTRAAQRAGSQRSSQWRGG